jgi:Restriction endonuclease
VDGKGVPAGADLIFVVECKHYPDRKVNQGTVAGLAWTIQDVGASGGIIVTPLGLQEGAEIIARHANVHTVLLTPESTPVTYVMRYLENLWVGVHDGLTCTDGASDLLIRQVPPNPDPSDTVTGTVA